MIQNFLPALGAISLAAVAVSSPVLAQSSPAAACVNGNVAIVRISKILPTGSMAGFNKAVADHTKWYADHGYTADRQVVAPILVYDDKTKTVSAAKDQVMTLHTNATSVPMAKHDAAWDAYVAEYRSNSDILSETVVCMPK